MRSTPIMMIDNSCADEGGDYHDDRNDDDDYCDNDIDYHKRL